jgi:hypothetical protein
VNADRFSFPDRNWDATVVCASCGYNKKFIETLTPVRYSSGIDNPIDVPNVMVGAPVDPFFRLPLWLQENVGGDLLWVYNHEHLEFIRRFVDSGLRERTGQEYLNSSLGSRLPRWLTSKKNRTTVLKAIEKLKRR